MSSRESRMSSTTVAQFANELNRPAKEPLELLRDAGVELSSVDDAITEADKAKLLTSLQRRAHGSRRITLTHRETSEIRQADSSGRSRTIPVEPRRSVGPPSCDRLLAPGGPVPFRSRHGAAAFL